MRIQSFTTAGNVYSLHLKKLRIEKTTILSSIQLLPPICKHLSRFPYYQVIVWRKMRGTRNEISRNEATGKKFELRN